MIDFRLEPGKSYSVLLSGLDGNWFRYELIDYLFRGSLYNIGRSISLNGF